MIIQRFHVGKRMSEMAVCNKTVYLAGQVASKTIDSGIHEQTAEVLEQVERLLAEAGTDKTRILSCQIFLTDINHIEQMNQIWDSWVSLDNSPPRATVQTKLANPKWLIEVVVTAAQGG
jgi:enamine deaminase RidA (YjgF/YER057c/UK114 family)